jgi:hypothetical protein
MPVSATSRPRNEGGREQRAFDHFLRTQSYELRAAQWESRGLAEPIDFICPELKIGIELTEWLSHKASQWVVERDRFRAEILDAIAERPSPTFREGGTGITVQIYILRQPPSRSEKQNFIALLLDFLENYVQANRAALRAENGATLPGSALPSALQRYVADILLYVFPSHNLGVVVSRGRLILDVAIDAFRDRLKEKVIAGCEKYMRERQKLALKELWLVVHYSSPGIFPEPFSELGLQVGYGPHRRESQRAVAEELAAVAREIGCGPFDRIFFSVDCQPEAFAAEILGSDRR